MAILAVSSGAVSAEPAAQAEFTQVSNSLTLEHLKNGSYQLPDNACGYKIVKLHNGKGDTQGTEVVFGRASFGKLTDKKEIGAVIHLAYKDEMFGWLQQIVFVVSRGDKLLQIGELGIDEREQLRNIEVRDGDVLIETAIPDEKSGKVYKKCLKAQLVETSEGCELTSTQWNWYTTEGSQEPVTKLVSLRP